jgi:phenylacetate-coenzyme A ligase PaaK-like adenylate-forming protein
MDPWGSLARLSPAEMRALQNAKLRRFINHYIYPFSPHYRKLFDDHKIDPKSIRTVDDLRRIPFTSKLDLIDDSSGTPRYRDYILQPDKEKIKKSWPAGKLIGLAACSAFRGKEYVESTLSHEFRPVFMTFTTGTTNKPVPFIYTNHDIANLHTSGARMLDLFEIPKTDRIINMFPFAPHLAFWQVVFGGLAACTLCLSTGGGRVLGTEGNINAINRMQPSMILGVPSYVYHLLREAREKKCDFSFIKKIVLGAARVTQGFKLKLAELLEGMGGHDINVFGTYGFTESRCAWAESPTALDESSGYYLYPDKEIFEIIDPKTGEVKKEGEDGEIVYTSIDSRGSAVIRYRTGDFVKGGITYAPDKNSRLHVPRLSSDITRLSDVKDLQLSKVKGALINLSNFSAIFEGIAGVDEWQIEIRKKDDDPYEVDHLAIYLCAKNGVDREKLNYEIKEKILGAMEITPNSIEYIGMDEMVKRLELETANKEKRILDKRPKI